MKTENQYAVRHNVILFYYTGLYNNTSLLDRKEKSKWEIFYITLYMAKEKASLTSCMIIIENFRKEISLVYPAKWIPIPESFSCL